MRISPVESPPGTSLWLAELGDTLAPPRWELLGENEWDRAHRLVFPDDRRRYIAAHAALRVCLGAWTGTAPQALRFFRTPEGKPSIEGASGWHFSFSRSAELALIAGSMSGPIGVDIEAWHALPDVEDFMASAFTASERLALLRPHDKPQDAAVLDCWTRKEACLKATGQGIDLDLTHLDVGATRDARHVRVPQDGGEPVEVRVESVDLGAWNASAAIAIVLEQHSR